MHLLYISTWIELKPLDKVTCQTSEKIAHILRNMKFHYRVQRVQNVELHLLNSARKQFGILCYFIPQSPKDKSKSKVLLLHPMKAYRGSRGIAPLIFKLGARWSWVVNFTPRPFHDLERTPVHSEQEAGWAQSRSGRFAEATNFFPYQVSNLGPSSL
jgi:hypothetical protein